MPLIPFPDVPKALGVPAVARSAKFPPAARAALGLIQGALWRVLQIETRWGIFDSKGKALADPSKLAGVAAVAAGATGIGSQLSTDAVTFSKETRVSDFPVERGSFASYNKVEAPAAPTVTLCLSGSESDRKKFLDAIDAACKSTDLYSVVTPEVTYVDFALERYNYQRRSSRGATLLIVEISLREIRQVSAQYAKTTPKEPGATDSVDNGKVQAKAPAQSTLKSIAGKLGIGG